MKNGFLIVLLCLVTACNCSAQAAGEPNYLVTGFFGHNSQEVYSVSDFNDQGMVCGTWKRFTTVNVAEEAGGVFIWHEGVMRKITPEQVGITHIANPTPSQGSRVGGTARMTNVRSDGTLLLAAPALQTKSTPNGVEPIYRIIVYTISGDLKTNAVPVVGGRALGDSSGLIITERT